VANKLYRLANSFIRKWLDLPRCLSEVGLFSRNTMPLRSIGLGYKQNKTQVVLELRESNDPEIQTGRKCTALKEVDMARAESRRVERALGEARLFTSGQRPSMKSGEPWWWQK